MASQSVANDSTTIDEVVIRIQTDAKNATNSIHQLSESLRDLKQAQEGGFNNLKKLSESLGELARISPKLKNIGNAADSISKLVTSLQPLNNINANGFARAVTGLGKLPRVLPNLFDSMSTQNIAKLGQLSHQLSVAMQSLNSVKGNGFANAVNAFQKLPNAIKDVQPQQIDQVAKMSSRLAVGLTQLSDIKAGGFDKAISAFSKIPATVNQLTPETIDRVVALGHNLSVALAPLENVKATGFTRAINALGRIPEKMSQITPTALENVGRVSTELASKLAPLSDRMREIADGYSAISALANRYGVSVTKIYSKTEAQIHSFKSLRSAILGLLSPYSLLSRVSKSFGNAATKQFTKLSSKIKQVGLSLLGTRTIFTLVRKAVGEYMQMDQMLTDRIQNVWRAMGALLAPAVEEAIYLFKQFARVVYSVIKALTGFDLIARANERATAGWGKATKDLLGNLQKFDDLNVVDFKKSGAGDNAFIDLQEIDLSPIQKIIDWVKKLKEAIIDAFNNGGWKQVGVVFGEGINGAINSFLQNSDKIAEKLHYIAYEFGGFINGALETINWTNFANSISNVIKTAFSTVQSYLDTINWEEIGKSITDFMSGINLSELIDSALNLSNSLISNIINTLANADWAVIGRELSNAFISFLGGLDNLINSINWEKLGSSIAQAIKNIDWKKLITGIGTLIKDILSGLNIFGEGLFGSENWEGIKNMLLVMGGIVGTVFATKKVLDFKNAISETVGVFGMFGKDKKIGDKDSPVGGTFDGIQRAAQFAAVLGGLALVITSVSGLLKTLDETGIGVGEMFGIMGAIMVPVTALMVLVAKLGPEMTAGLVPFLAIVGGISATLLVLKLTLPTILESATNFINDIAPSIVNILDTIGKLITDIIHSLGDVLPPIIESIGDVFDVVFTGIADVVGTIGDSIVNILDASARLVDNLATTILRFIRELGPAIEVFVNSAIRSTTRLINFLISGIEYTINTLLINSINGLIRKLNDVIPGSKYDIGSLGYVYIPRFVPKLETGTNEIPYEGLYHLHQGEAVVPKKYNPAVGNTTSEETNQKLDSLLYAIENLSFNNTVNIGNEKLYEKQEKFNKYQMNKYGVIEL